jgi:AcrR family transcriptional regulator
MTTTPSRRRAPAMSPDQRRDMIVRIALPLVAEHGTAVTTSQVARAAGIAEGTLFRAFADKSELIAACVAEALRAEHLLDEHLLNELAAIPLDRPLADRLVDAAESLRAHLDRMGAVLGALHASGHTLRRPEPGEAHAAGLDRQVATDQIRDAVAELFAPERDRLRLPAEQLATAFLRLMRPPHRCPPVEEAVRPDTVALVDLFLHGALA